MTTEADEEFVEKIKAAGYKEFPWPKTNWCEGRAFGKRLAPGSPQCLTNEHKTGYHLYRYDPLPPNVDPQRVSKHSIELEIVGEYREGLWCDFKLYAISEERFFEERELLEKELLNAWAAVARARDTNE